MSKTDLGRPAEVTVPAANHSVDLVVNGAAVSAMARTLLALLGELGYEGRKVATAVNGAFVADAQRAATPLAAGDRIEILAPRQGG